MRNTTFTPGITNASTKPTSEFPPNVVQQKQQKGLTTRVLDYFTKSPSNLPPMQQGSLSRLTFRPVQMPQEPKFYSIAEEFIGKANGRKTLLDAGSGMLGAMGAWFQSARTFLPQVGESWFANCLYGIPLTYYASYLPFLSPEVLMHPDKYPESATNVLALFALLSNGNNIIKAYSNVQSIHFSLKALYDVLHHPNDYGNNLREILTRHLTATLTSNTLATIEKVSFIVGSSAFLYTKFYDEFIGQLTPELSCFSLGIAINTLNIAKIAAITNVLILFSRLSPSRFELPSYRNHTKQDLSRVNEPVKFVANALDSLIHTLNDKISSGDLNITEEQASELAKINSQIIQIQEKYHKDMLDLSHAESEGRGIHTAIVALVQSMKKLISRPDNVTQKSPVNKTADKSNLVRNLVHDLEKPIQQISSLIHEHKIHDKFNSIARLSPKSASPASAVENSLLNAFIDHPSGHLTTGDIFKIFKPYIDYHGEQAKISDNSVETAAIREISDGVRNGLFHLIGYYYFSDILLNKGHSPLEFALSFNHPTDVNFLNDVYNELSGVNKHISRTLVHAFLGLTVLSSGLTLYPIFEKMFNAKKIGLNTNEIVRKQLAQLPGELIKIIGAMLASDPLTRPAGNFLVPVGMFFEAKTDTIASWLWLPKDSPKKVTPKGATDQGNSQGNQGQNKDGEQKEHERSA